MTNDLLGGEDNDNYWGRENMTEYQVENALPRPTIIYYSIASIYNISHA